MHKQKAAVYHGI